ncbi:hypothetical protein SAMN05421823_104447 [Catalinimonas alkaloidigena]|uniref:DUF4476 domain-containing protein n=1 Tax=Catalinimonas alkaloidigena TaxID=1075417 RepID=A0A1G9HIJ3_9BACT|nr:hypothetical protein [Catalinimonas alkaloidigena]SDL12715.1 hypothetical protein SAMN05421823_104447 [Catalinimonas alkaloidigena]
MKRLLSFFVLILLTHPLAAQWTKGRLFTWEGDTLKGQVRYIANDVVEIDQQGQVLKFTPEQIQGFDLWDAYLNGVRYYQALKRGEGNEELLNIAAFFEVIYEGEPYSLLGRRVTMRTPDRPVYPSMSPYAYRYNYFYDPFFNPSRFNSSSTKLFEILYIRNAKREEIEQYTDETLVNQNRIALSFDNPNTVMLDRLFARQSEAMLAFIKQNKLNPRKRQDVIDMLREYNARAETP